LAGRCLSSQHGSKDWMRRPSHHLRMFTALPATITTVVIEASASINMSTLARDGSGIVSVGLKAVAFVNDR
jgi:hypothetical protein